MAEDQTSAGVAPPLTAEAFDAMMARTLTIAGKDLPAIGVGVYEDQDGRPLLTIGRQVIAVIPYVYDAISQQMDRFREKALSSDRPEDHQG